MSAATSTAHARRGAWLKTLHQWHWISSGICLLAMLLFSVTGITLNHAGQIEARPSVKRLSAALPAELAAPLKAQAAGLDGRKAALPAAALHWLSATWGLDAARYTAEWASDEVYLPMPRPGGDAWVRLALDSGKAEFEVTDRGWISWLNDMHKGRNAGAAWSWFIDLFAVACLLFCVTGLLILKFHAAHRPLTWPVVGLGVLLPALIALLFIH